MGKLKSITIEEDNKIMIINPHPTTEIEFTKEYETELLKNYNKHYVYEPDMSAQRRLVSLTIHIYDGQGLEGVIIDE